MLRLAVGVVSALVLVVAIGLIVGGVNGGIVGIGWVAVQAAIVLVAILAERGRYRPTPSGTTWTRTAERFQDPTTGRWVAVEYDPRTGERRYVEEG